MKWKVKMQITPTSAVKNRRGGFTLIEVLAALLLMAIVVPVVARGLSIASMAGEVSQRKSLAARVAEKVLNQAIISGQWNQSGQTGVEMQGPYKFQWTIKNESWKPLAIVNDALTENAMREVSVEVTFTAQGKKCLVHVATLINSQAQ